MNYNKTTRQQGIETRKRILGAIKGYIIQHKYPPTIREICDMTGIKSTSTIQAHIERMIDTGILETDAEYNSRRALRIPGMRIEFEELEG